MPKLVCRLRWRKGLPLGLSVSSETSCFLDLPPEIRNKIYHYSLVASEPLTIWSGSHDDDKTELPESLTLTSHIKVKIDVSFSNGLALGLLCCNRQVSSETAGILYQENTFRFLGENNWNPLYGFLQSIGEENRHNLRSLEIAMHKPKQLWQHLDGTCTDHTPWWRLCEVVPRPMRSQNSSALFKEGFVDYLDPAIEACFRILGRRKSTLTLRLILWKDYLPEVMFDSQHPEDFLFGLDLPILIETLRRDLTSDTEAGGQVDVLWQGECLKDEFDEQIELIRNQGWLVVDTAKGSVNIKVPKKSTVLFTLRRK